MHDVSVACAQRDVERIDVPHDDEHAIGAAHERHEILLREPGLLERQVARGRGAIRVRVEGADRAGDAVAAAGHRELKALHVVRGDPADDAKGVGIGAADEASEIFFLRRLPGAERLREGVLVGDLVPVQVRLLPDAVERIAHGSGDENHRIVWRARGGEHRSRERGERDEASSS